MDIRKIKTKKKIQNALLNLLNSYQFDRITISLLCSEAQVNRGTFYLHYERVEDVLLEMENALYQDIIKCLESGDKDFLLLIFRKVKENGRLVSSILYQKLDYGFIERIINIARDYCTNQWKKAKPDVSQSELDYAYSFLSRGMVGVVSNWCSKGFKDSPEDVTKMLKSLVSYFSISFAFNFNAK